jgi:hypothetical protein
MAYTIVKQISDSRTEAVVQNGEVAEWLQNLAEYAAQFFKKFL